MTSIWKKVGKRPEKQVDVLPVYCLSSVYLFYYGAPGVRRLLVRHMYSFSHSGCFDTAAVRLLEVLDDLPGNIMSQKVGSELIKMHFREPHSGRRRFHGLEYMAFVVHSNDRKIAPKCMYLNSSSGLWGHYAKDARVLVLFGSSFGSHPAARSARSTRQMHQMRGTSQGPIVPGHTYRYSRSTLQEAGMNVAKTEQDDNNGWTLQARDDPFKQCDDAKTGAHRELCCSNNRRVAQPVKQSSRNNPRFTHQLAPTGAIIVGDPGPNSLKKEADHEYQASIVIGTSGQAGK